MQVIFDLNHLAYRTFFSNKNDIEQVGFKYHQHVMLDTIIRTALKFNATEVFVCVDHKLNWRKKIYPDYKAQRKDKKDKDDVDWDAFYENFDDFVNNCKKFFPFYVIRVKYLEADDIASVLSKIYQDKKKVIITSDTDYIQLLRYKNVNIYDPIKKINLKENDPIRALKIKCLMGDRSDNIPAIKPRTGIKTAEKLADNAELLKEVFNEELGDEYKENYKRNIKLIDLNRIPDKLIQKTISEIEKYEIPDGKKIFSFLAKNKFRNLMNRLNEIEILCNNIKNQEEIF